jgi:hypothetical protein
MSCYQPEPKLAQKDQCTLKSSVVSSAKGPMHTCQLGQWDDTFSSFAMLLTHITRELTSISSCRLSSHGLESYLLNDIHKVCIHASVSCTILHTTGRRSPDLHRRVEGSIWRRHRDLNRDLNYFFPCPKIE